MTFDSKETEDYFYNRCKEIECELTIREEIVIDYDYAMNYLDMIEDGLKTGRFTHINK